MGLILVVEDDRDIRETLADLLQDEGHVVATARDGIELIQALRPPLPDLILLDLMMPELDGLSSARILKNSARFREIPVVLISASGADTDSRRTALAQSRAEAFFTKPIDLPRLFQCVKGLLAGRAPRNGATDALHSLASAHSLNSLDVPCPVCLAPARAFCDNKGNQYQSHPARFRAAREAFRQLPLSDRLALARKCVLEPAAANADEVARQLQDYLLDFPGATDGDQIASCAAALSEAAGRLRGLLLGPHRA